MALTRDESTSKIAKELEELEARHAKEQNNARLSRVAAEQAGAKKREATADEAVFAELVATIQRHEREAEMWDLRADTTEGETQARGEALRLATIAALAKRLSKELTERNRADEEVISLGRQGNAKAEVAATTQDRVRATSRELAELLEGDEEMPVLPGTDEPEWSPKDVEVLTAFFARKPSRPQAGLADYETQRQRERAAKLRRIGEDPSRRSELKGLTLTDEERAQLEASWSKVRREFFERNPGEAQRMIDDALEELSRRPPGRRREGLAKQLAHAPELIERAEQELARQEAEEQRHGDRILA